MEGSSRKQRKKKDEENEVAQNSLKNETCLSFSFLFLCFFPLCAAFSSLTFQEQAREKKKPQTAEEGTSCTVARKGGDCSKKIKVRNEAARMGRVGISLSGETESKGTCATVRVS